MRRRKLPIRRRRNWCLKSAQKGYLRKSLRSIFLIISVIGVLLLGFSAIKIVSSSIWDGKSRISFVFQRSDSQGASGSVYLASYLPVGKRLVVFSFPGAAKIEVAGDYGRWRIGSVYPLGVLEDKEGRLLTSSISSLLGAVVEGWIVVDNEIKMNSDNSRQILQKAILTSFGKRGFTNFSLWDRFRLFRALSSVRGHHVDWLDMGKAGVLREEEEPDGSLILVAVPELMDKLSQEYLFYSQVVEEGVSVAVLNATGRSGLGTSVSRLIRNIGGDVVSVSNYVKDADQNQVIVSREELLDSFTTKKLIEVFQVDKVKVGDTSENRAELLLILGEE